MSKKAGILLATLLVLFPSPLRAQENQCDGAVVDVMRSERAADVYVSLGKDANIRVSDFGRVFRRLEVVGETQSAGRVDLYVGRLQIIDVQDSVSIGRMIDFAPREKYPQVRYETVMVGDCVVLETRAERPEAAAPTAVEVLPGSPSTQVKPPEDVPPVRRLIPTKVLFETDSARISDEWQEELSQLATFIHNEKPARVVVEGHADATGTESHNMRLSERRARAVVDYMVERHGIERSVFDIKAYGESAPIASNQSPEGRQENRRASVTVLVEVTPTVGVPAQTPSAWPPLVEPERLLPEDVEIPVLPFAPADEPKSGN
jgi:outer membrane protein OmpA-like peptidoglycan-associated protein